MANFVWFTLIFGMGCIDVMLITGLATLNVFSWIAMIYYVIFAIFNVLVYLVPLKCVLHTRKYIIFDSESQKIIQVFKSQKKKQTKSFKYEDIIGYKIEKANKISAKNARRYDWWFPNLLDSESMWVKQGYIEIEGNKYVCILTAFSRRKVEKELNKIKQIIEQDKDKQIESLTKTLANLKQTNADLIFEIEQLRNQVGELHGDKVPQVETDIHIAKTTELREINSLLDQIADYELNDEALQLEQTIIDLEQEFEFTPKAKLALILLLDSGLYRDQFKKELMREHEIIDSFIGEVNGYFEDEYSMALIVENKNHFTINPELFE